jgi:hypothetical protein
MSRLGPSVWARDRDRGHRPVRTVCVRAALPKAFIVVDKWHVVALANQMVTEVQQRVTRESVGPPRRRHDPVWVNRRLLLLTGSDHMSVQQWRRLEAMLDRCDPTKEIGPAWDVKERLRMLLTERGPSRISGIGWPTCTRQQSMRPFPRPPGWRTPSRPGGRRFRSGSPHPRALHAHRRVQPDYQQTKRVACGHRNMINYQRRILSHIVITAVKSSMTGSDPARSS